MSRLTKAIKAFRTALTDVPRDMNTFGNMMSEAFIEDSRLNNDAIKTNSYVNIAVGKIANNAARAKIKIKQGDDLITTGPIVKLFDWVNQQMSESQLIQASASWWFTRGEFIWILKSDVPGRVPSSLFVPDPKEMVHFVNEAKEITMWELRTLKGDNIPYLPSEVFHVKDWNPFDNYRGVNPLYAMDSELESDFLANLLNSALLKNRATPDGVLISDQPLSVDAAKDIKERWQKAHSTGSAHGIAVLGQGTKYQPIALSLADMEFFSLKKWNRTTIAGKYGVPPIAMGYKDDTSPLSGADSKEQMAFFWTQTIIPFLKTVEDKVNSDLMSRFAPNQKFVFGLDTIQELAEDAELIRERARKDIASGLLLINEAREEIGRDPVSWGDVWYKPINLVPLNEEPTAPIINEPLNDKDITILFDKEDGEDITTLFNRQEEIYDDAFKNTHWHALHKILEVTLKNSKKDVADWLYNMRSSDLKYDSLNDFDKMLEDRDGFFTEYKQALYDVSHRLILGTGETTNQLLNEFYTDIDLKEIIGFEMSAEFSQPHMGHFGYFFDQFREELVRVADKKLLYNQMKSAVSEIVETEGLTLFNEIRVNSFRTNGFKAHIWVSPKDGLDIDLNVDGEIRMIGDRFSNGKLLPDNKSITLPVEVN